MSASPFSAPQHIATLIQLRWPIIAPADAAPLDGNATLDTMGKRLKEIVPNLFRDCVLKLAQENRGAYVRALTANEQHREDRTMEIMRHALHRMFAGDSVGGLTLKSLGKHLQELLNSTKTYANTPNEFPWGPLAFALKFLMTQNGGGQVSCLYFSVAMILLRVNASLNHTLIEACLQLALVANPNHYQALAQWGNVVKAVSPKDQKTTNEMLLYCFNAASWIEESLQQSNGGSSNGSCISYGCTLRGIADLLYRCAVRLPSVERRGVLKASYKHLKRANEQKYVPGLRTLGCVCLMLGGKYEVEGKKAFEDIVADKKAPANFREKAAHVLAEVRKGVQLVHIVMTNHWEVLAP